LTRALKAASKGGFVAGRVEVAQDGRIVLISEKAAPGKDEAEVNEWDRL
jgi:hypothetical protein